MFISLRQAAIGAALCGLAGSAGAATHQAPKFADMAGRIDQLAQILEGSESCAAKGAALDLTLGLVYGGTRPLPTALNDAALEGADDADIEIAKRAERVNEVIRPVAERVIAVLHGMAMGGACPDLAGQAADLKFLLKEMEDVASALSEFTAACTVGDSLREGRCAQLVPVLNELTGHIWGDDERVGDGAPPERLFAGFKLKLRSPFVPRWTRVWEEDVKATPALAPGECASIFKETKGLMLRLRLDGFTLVRDPWATAQLPRGTKIPIWTLEWVPSEYVKHFNICNNDGRIAHVTVNQRVKQDIPLNYFWRYYRKTP